MLTYADYPTGGMLTPPKKRKDKQSYWLDVWKDPPNSEMEARHNPDTVRKNKVVVKDMPEPACGKNCREQAQGIFAKVDESLRGEARL